MLKFALIGVATLGSLLPFAAHAAVTCAQVRCMAGTTCVEVRGGNAQCVADTTTSSVSAALTEAEPSVSQQATATCAATTCPVGTNCIDTPQGARCVGAGAQQQPRQAEEEEEPAGCLLVLCAAGTLCVDSEEGAVCLPILQERSSSALGQTGQVSQTGQTGQSDAEGGTGPGNPTCAATLCAVGSRCIMTGMGAVCVPHPDM